VRLTDVPEPVAVPVSVVTGPEGAVPTLWPEMPT
jgi:hypothetical protein